MRNLEILEQKAYDWELRCAREQIKFLTNELKTQKEADLYIQNVRLNEALRAKEQRLAAFGKTIDRLEQFNIGAGYTIDTMIKRSDELLEDLQHGNPHLGRAVYVNKVKNFKTSMERRLKTVREQISNIRALQNIYSLDQGGINEQTRLNQ